MRKFGLGLLLCALLAACGPKVEPPVGAPPLASSEMDALARDVAAEINLMRKDPFAYSARLKALKSYFRHSPSCEPPLDPCRLVLPGEVVVGVANYQAFLARIDEAAEDLQNSQPLPLFSPSAALKRSATAHVADKAALASPVPHKGGDGSNFEDRINREGLSRGRLAEAIMFGKQTPFGVVSAWLVDLDIESRLHRRILLDPQMGALGVACGPSPKHRLACVADFAESVTE